MDARKYNGPQKISKNATNVGSLILVTWEFMII